MIFDQDIPISSVNFVIDFDNFEKEEQLKEDQKKFEKLDNNKLIF